MVYVFLAEGFEEIEAVTPIDILLRAGLDVKTVAVGSSPVTGAHGIRISADIGLDEVNLEQAELLVLPGGMPGTTNLEASEALQSFLQGTNEKGVFIGAICAAPSILGHMGLLSGKRATCFPGYEEALSGASVQNAGVVVDGNLITARGAGCAAEFGFALAALFVGEDTAAQLRRSMQYKD